MIWLSLIPEGCNSFQLKCPELRGVIFRSPRVTMAFQSGLKTRRAQD